MAEDQDLASLLPRAPPPSPARREAAIDAALRRFDGEPAMAPSRPSGAVQWLWQRPQFGAAVAACLLVAVGLPLALVTEADRTRSIGPRPVPSVESQAVKARPTSGARSSAPRNSPPSTISSVGEAPAEEVAVQRTAAPDAREAAAAPALKAAAQAVPESDPPALAPVAPLPSALAPAPPSSPPPLAAPMEGADAIAASSSLGAMASARRARTGAVRGFSIRDPNRAAAPLNERIAAPSVMTACTIEDPERSLARCNSIDPAATGSAGRAAARISDGLNHAWQGNLPAARHAFDQAVAADPRSSLAYLNRGLVRERQGDSTGARADLIRAAQLAPTSALVRYHLERTRQTAGSTQPRQGE